MKKILYITFNEILGNTGGSLGQKKIYLSLKNLKEKGKILFDTISLDTKLDEQLFVLKKNRLSDVYSRLCGHSNFLFLYKRRIVKALKKNSYDILLLGNSRLGFIAKKAHKYVKRVLTHFDNIEYDYAANRMSGNKLVQQIELSHVYQDEKASIIHSDINLFLSKRDENRAKELYRVNLENTVIFPVCLENLSNELPLTNKPSLLFTGSLNYGPNIDSVRKCISLVNQLKNVKLIVGGSSPSDEIRELCFKDNIETHYNFSSLAEFAHKGDILVIPSDHGAGMKVKVAEAMKYGFIVLGSKETFVGYEKALEQSRGLVVCNCEKDFLTELNRIINLNIEQINKLSVSNVNAFKENYSIERAFKIVDEVLSL